MMKNQGKPFIPAERPRPTIFAATGVVLLAAVGLWIASIAALWIVPEAGMAQDILLNALYYLPFVLLPIAIYRLRHRGLSDALRLNPMPVLPLLTVIFLGLLSVYAASAADSLWALLLDAAGLHEPDVSLSLESSRALTLSIINTAAVPAVCEELLFRGFAFAAWESRGTKLALWVSTLLFALLHGNLYGLPAYLMVGAISAYLVFALDSLYAGIIYHTVYNTAILVIVYLLAGQGDATAVPEGSLMLSIAMELLVIGGVMLAMLYSLSVRRRLAGIEPIPRIREPLRVRERVLLIVLLAVMAVTTVLVLAGV